MSNYRGMIPGMFTAGNIVCGFVAMLSVIDGHVLTACWFVILAGFLDALDGKVARLSGGESQFGIELDSLADIVSFGIAPAVIMHEAVLKEFGNWGWIVAVVYVLSTAYRLARFNVTADREKKYFQGLPVPAAAYYLVTYVIFSTYCWGEIRYHEFLIISVVLVSFLMASQIEFDIIPDRFRRPMHLAMVGVAVIAIGVLVARPSWSRVLLFPLVAAYILTGLVREAIRLVSRNDDSAERETKEQPGDLEGPSDAKY